MNNLLRKFWAYDAANPDIYDTMVTFARKLISTGRRKVYGIQSVLERVRWHYDVDVNRTDEFKINNDFAACYSRLIQMRNPDLFGFFNVRVSDADLLVWDGETWEQFVQRKQDVAEVRLLVTRLALEKI